MFSYNNNLNLKSSSHHCKYELFPNYQPIVSVLKKKIIGYEGLIRGINRADNSIVLPNEIFSAKAGIKEKTRLDRLCREMCLRGAKTIFEKSGDICIFINLEVSTISHVLPSFNLLNQVIKYDINPRNVVIEINESKTNNIYSLMRFIEEYKKKGFLIALDDVGTGFSNFERITLVKPDILKIDRTLVQDIDKSYYKQEVFRGLVRLANKIRALVVAEGIETYEEAIRCIEYDAHFLQGYYFEKPHVFEDLFVDKIEIKTKDLYEKYKNYMGNKIEAKRKYKHQLEGEINKIIRCLENNHAEQYGELINQFISDLSCFDIECTFILDEDGIQISDTYMFYEKKDKRKEMMFLPANKGADHSLKKYYYELINSKIMKYISEPYISSATGNLCVTLSRVFKDLDGNKKILCIDKNPHY